MASIARIDAKGRVVIPKRLREEAGLGRVAKIRAEGGRIIIEPIESPLERLKSNVKLAIADIESELRGLRKVAEEWLMKEVSERWC